MTQIPSNVSQFYEALDLANRGIQTASQNQIAKMQADIERSRIGVERERLGLARDQMLLSRQQEAEQLYTRQQEMESQRAHEEEMQQKHQEFQAAQTDKQARIEASFMDAQNRWEQEKARVRAEKLQAVLEGRLVDEEKMDARIEELNEATRTNKENVATFSLMNTLVQGGRERGADRLMSMIEDHDASIRTLRDNLRVGMQAGLPGLALVGGRAQEGRSLLRQAVRHPSVRPETAVLEAKGKLPADTAFRMYVDGDVTAEAVRGAAAKEVIRSFTDNVNLDVVGSKGETADVRSALRGYLEAVVDADTAARSGQPDDAKVSERLGALIASVGGTQSAGLLLSSVQEVFSDATVNADALTGTFGDQALSAEADPSGARRGRVMRMLKPLRDLHRISQATGKLEEEAFVPISSRLMFAKAADAIRRGDPALARQVGIDLKMEEKIDVILQAAEDAAHTRELAAQRGMSLSEAQRVAALGFDRRLSEVERMRMEETLNSREVLRLDRQRAAAMEDAILQATVEGMLGEPEAPNLSEALEGLLE